MEDLIQSAQWEGIPHVESFTYSAVHGITPGEFRLITAPGDDEEIDPAPFGELILTDGFRTLVLRDCKIEAVEATYSTSEGKVFSIKGYDRRWRWRNMFGGLGAISGRYNQLDRRGKLVPWSIRSPEELARLCLEAAGETNYEIRLPDGIRKAQGANLDRYLRLGENFPQTMNNPYVTWEHRPPMEALSELADMFNCRIVYQPYTDKVLVVPLGDGDAELPNDPPFEMAAPSITAPACPKSVGVYGPPPRIQGRVRLEAVGEEYDGSIMPIDMLSYAPKGPPTKKQKATITYTGKNVASTEVPQIFVEVVKSSGGVSGSFYLGDANYPAGTSLATRWGYLQANGQINTPYGPLFTWTYSGSVFTVEARDPGTEFNIRTSGASSSKYVVKITDKPSEAGKTWKFSPPPHFRGVLPTDRLSHMEAVALAQKRVFRSFRITNLDPNDETKPLMLPIVLPGKEPSFATLKRIQQLIAQPTKAEQVVPLPRIAGGTNKGNVIGVNDPNFGGGILPEFYNGRSRDQQATVTGSVWRRLGGMQVYYAIPKSGDTFNTERMDRLQIPFSLETTETGDQIVNFSDYVYKFVGGGPGGSFIAYPDLVLETAFLVMDPETDQVYRWEKTLPIEGGTAPTEWTYHEDLQVAVVATYSENSHARTGWKWATGDLEHVNPAAKYYLEAHASKYILQRAETRQYIGIWPASPNGTIQEVTWRGGREGPSTIVGINHEPGIQILPWTARRRNESLPPNKAAVASNAAERAIVDRMYPSPGSPRT